MQAASNHRAGWGHKKAETGVSADAGGFSPWDRVRDQRELRVETGVGKLLKISGLTRGKMTFRGGARKMGRSHMALARATSSTTTGRSSKIAGWVK
jgi:hypothetical protein